MGRVVVEVEGEGLSDVAPQIPRAESLDPGTRVVVFPGKAKGWLGKLVQRRAAPPPVLGSALLARGYVDIAAGEEQGRQAAWGFRR